MNMEIKINLLLFRFIAKNKYKTDLKYVPLNKRKMHN